MARTRHVIIGAIALGLSWLGVQSAYAQCKDLAKPAKDVKFDKEVKADARPGVVYLSLVGGASKANKCGQNPKNDAAAWTGWGGPLDTDNASIGEGIGTRNFITIGGTRFARGVGTHSVGTLIYDLTTDTYKKFQAVVGLDDEKDGGLAAPECGHGGSSQFTFTIDGKEMYKSPVLKGVDANKQVAGHGVEFDIPAGARELTIVIGDGGDGASCDHGDLGDAKLLTGAALAVEPAGKAATTWGTLRRM